jgi:hypothetical protein
MWFRVIHAFPGASEGTGLASSSVGTDGVPEINGIVIAMYHNEHGAPHFHAVHAGRRTLARSRKPLRPVDPLE